MRNRLKFLTVAVAVLIASVAQKPVNTQTTPHWQVGDVFVGVGFAFGNGLSGNLGEHLVYSPDGTFKELILDQLAATFPGSTTGCAAGRPLPGGGFADEFYATTFDSLRLIKFGAAHDGTAPNGLAHARTDIRTLTSAEHYATESIVFDRDGNYFVASHPTQDYVGIGDRPTHAFLYKFDANDQPIDADPTDADPASPYKVKLGHPTSVSDVTHDPWDYDWGGIDWIDLGADQKTIYYTTEGTRIYKFNTAGTDNPATAEDERLSWIQLKQYGSEIQGSTFALRLLPPMPGSDEPSGYLVALDSGPARVAPNGEIVLRYQTPVGGLFFALNLAPDGQTFWTATLGDGSVAFGGGWLMRFHISTGELIGSAINTGKGNVSGLCVKREYTAALNSCYQMNLDGSPMLVNGQPVPVACRVPEICGNSLNDDGDQYTTDDSDPDCVKPGSPVLVQPEDQHDYEGDSPTLQLQATDPLNGALTYSATHLPPGLTISSSGLISGTLTWSSAGSYTVSVKVTGTGNRTAEARFVWKVDPRNAPPTLTGPAAVTCLIGAPCPEVGTIRLQVFDAESDSVNVSTSNMPPGMTVPSLVHSPGGPAGNLPNYSFFMTGTPVLEGVFDATICIVDRVHREPFDNDPVIDPYLDATGMRVPVCHTIKVTITNTAPTFTLLIGPQSHIVNQPMSAQVQAVDPDNNEVKGISHDPITFEASPLPAGVTIDPNTGIISGSPLDELNNVTITVSAKDRFGKPATTTFTWTVVNRPPVFSVTNQTNVVGVAITPFQIPATDAAADGSLHMPLSWSLANAPAGISIDAATGTVSGMPTAVGTFTVSATVADKFGKSTTHPFTWTVTNAAPALTVASQSHIVGAAITPVEIRGTDADGHTLTYTVTGLPAGLTFDASTLMVTGAPTTPGVRTVTATVSDGYETVTRTFTWTVTNAAPALTVSNQTNLVGAAIAAVQIKATDADGHTLSHTVTGLPAGLTYDTGTFQVTGTPTATGVSTVNVTVTDGFETVNRSFTWTITNAAPVLPVSDRTHPVGIAISPVSLAATDADGQPLTYTVSGLPAGLTFDSTTKAVTGTPTTVTSGTVSVTVTDGYEPVTRTFIWTITNAAPTFAVANQTTLVNTPVSLAINATDPDGHGIVYTITGLPLGLVHNGSGGISGSPVAAGTSTVTVTVRDAFGAETQKTFTWTVITNRQPDCSVATPSQALWPPNHKFVPVTLTNVSDPDGDPLTIQVVSIFQDEPVNTNGDGDTAVDGVIDGATAYIRAERTGDPKNPGNGRVYYITFRVSDATASCLKTVEVGVPHDQGGSSVPVGEGPLYDSTVIQPANIKK